MTYTRGGGQVNAILDYMCESVNVRRGRERGRERERERRGDEEREKKKKERETRERRYSCFLVEIMKVTRSYT